MLSSSDVTLHPYVQQGLYTLCVLLAFIFLELAAILLLYYRSGRDTDKGYIFGFAFFFIFMAIGRIFYIFFDFADLLEWTQPFALTAKKVAISMTTSSLIPMFFIVETRWTKRKPVIAFIIAALPIATFFYPGIVWFATAIPILFLLLFFIHLWKNAIGIVKKSAASITIGLVLIGAGLAFGAARDLGERGLPLVILGYLFQFFGAGLLVYGILNIPSFTEFEWKKYFLTFYIVHKKSGITLYSYKEIGNVSSNLLSGFFTALNNLSEAEFQTEPPKILDAGPIKFVLEHGEYVYIIGIAKKYLFTIRKILRELLEQFEAHYDNLLKSENVANVTRFEDFRKIVDEAFSE